MTLNGGYGVWLRYVRIQAGANCVAGGNPYNGVGWGGCDWCIGFANPPDQLAATLRAHTSRRKTPSVK